MLLSKGKEVTKVPYFSSREREREREKKNVCGEVRIDVKELRKYFEQNNKKNYQIQLSYDMTNHADLGGCYPPRP